MTMGSITARGQSGAVTVAQTAAPDNVSATYADSKSAVTAAATIVQTGNITFNEMAWWGIYNGSGTPQPSADVFTLTIYQDSGGAVGPVVYSANIGSGNGTKNGNTIGTAPEYAYQAKFPPLTLSAGLYYVALSDNQPSGAVWAWASTSAAAGDASPLGGAVFQNGNWYPGSTENLAMFLQYAPPISGWAAAPAISVGNGFGSPCALTSAGEMQCWGDNELGQFGNGTTTSSTTPVPVTGLQSGVIAISVGSSSTCAVTSAGAAECWGYNAYGELGNGTTTNSTTPVPVTGLQSGVIAISAGGGFGSACAVTSVGAAQCWGDNRYGQLGNGTTTSSSLPVPVTGLQSGVIAISVGDLHTCAVTSAGAAVCWGNNADSQLGNGTFANSSTPVPVTGLQSGVIAISAGNDFTCALTNAGAVQCWGDSDSGALGNAEYPQSPTPIPVTGLQSGVTAISASFVDSACALTSAGAVQCWGNNEYGKLGNGTTTSSTTPVPVTGLQSGVIAISAGGFNGCALTDTGAVQCWGDNLQGQLGNGTTTNNSSTPVNVSGPILIAPTATETASTVASGQSVTLTVTPSGTGPFTYQWYQGTAGDTSDPISGATSSSYTTPPLSGSNSGSAPRLKSAAARSNTPSSNGGSTTYSYWVQVTTSSGVVEDSATITITVTGGSSGSSDNSTDGPIPLWAIGALGVGLVGIASRRLKRAA